jgi:glutathione S-transferase
MRFEVLTTSDCRWSIRNIVALTEKGADYVLVDVTGEGGKGKTPWYLALTPFGKTPALRHGDNVIVESLLMNEYIDETAGGRALMPAEPAARAWARIWMGHCDNTLMPKLIKLAKAEPQDRKARADEMSADFAIAERAIFAHSPPGGLWHGERLGLVDLCYWTLFNALDRTVVRLELDDLVLEFPTIATWRAKLNKSEVFTQAGGLLDRLEPGGELPGLRRST